jgi:hypothetical protein
MHRDLKVSDSWFTAFSAQIFSLQKVKKLN